MQSGPSAPSGATRVVVLRREVQTWGEDTRPETLEDMKRMARFNINGSSLKYLLGYNVPRCIPRVMGCSFGVKPLPRLIRNFGWGQ